MTTYHELRFKIHSSLADAAIFLAKCSIGKNEIRTGITTPPPPPINYLVG